MRNILLFAAMFAALAAVAVFQSPTLAISIINLCLISAIMALGVNMQWGYGGLFNVGIMGFAALGGVAAVLVSLPPRPEAWSAGGLGLLSSGLALVVTGVIVAQIRKRLPASRMRGLITLLAVIIGFFTIRAFFDPATDAIEALDPAQFGNIGGLGLPIILSWLVGGLFAAGAAWVVAKIALGLRSDYLAIATLGISEIVIAVLKNEDWLARGVKNVSGLSRPVPYEVDLQEAPWLIDLANTLSMSVNELSSIVVRGGYAALFLIVLIVLTWAAERALRSPWGRMMRAIRDNRDAAAAMGKDVTARHIQIFVLGSAIVGVAGAMLTTLEGQFTPGSYQPLRFTFLIWVMVIVGGSGNNWGSILGGFLIWFVWVQAEPAGLLIMDAVTAGFGEDSAIRAHLLDAAPHMRLLLMGLILLTVMRFSPRGLIPEVIRR
ncbi:branched-chain amino acid transport system permease protein [Rubricella aquisinus]|uniref:Branched-chain amino acid transport system permease protein n=1 Tax=Rubricella aquisinus TaxID=2028108 RepID=A0A840WSC4_9RHOB|nr:branched-chain amino acid ABC transporter permease [Rubricella aquisinus]MBB5516923.1 branched-chain amino acid transport system permease protein [Rubricella aquisinus]